MASLTAEDLQRKYGQELAAPPYMDIETAFLLRKALLARRPPLDVTVGVIKQWLKNYRTPPGAVRVATLEELHANHAGLVRLV